MALPLTESEELTKKIYEEAGLELPADLGTSLQQVQQQVAAQQAAMAPAAPAPVRPTAPAAQALPADLDDKALARAYLEKRNKTDLATAMNGAALISRGFGGSMPLNAGDAYIRNADNDIEAIQARRAQANQDLQRSDEQYKRELAAYKADPQSPNNRFVTTALQGIVDADSPAGQFLKDPQALDIEPKDALSLYVQHQKATRPLGSASDVVTPEERVAYDAMVVANAQKMGWTADQLDAHRQIVAAAGGKMLRSMYGALPGKILGTDTAKEVAADNREAANTRHGETQARLREKETDDQVDKFGKQVTDTTATIKTSLGKVFPLIDAASKKYGVIPGANLVSEWIGKNRLTNAYLNSPEEKEIRGHVDSLNILNRVDITGAAFGDREANELKQAYADLAHSENLVQSLHRLEDKVNTAVKKAYATKGAAARRIIKERFPELVAGLDVPGDGPAPAVPTTQPIVEPGGKVAPTAGRKLVKRVPSKDRTKFKLVYSDGSEEIVSAGAK